MGIFTICWALLITSVAAYISILGLLALFAGAGAAIIVLGVVLEGGKILATVLVHNYWHDPKFTLHHKIYLLSAICLSMVITSIGIYGYLSKGFLEQENPLMTVELQIQQKEQTISHLTETNDQLQKQLEQMDKSIQVFFDAGQATRGLAAREKQKTERDYISQQINQNNTNILNIRNDITSLKIDTSDVTAKLGPVKYVAELFGWNDYGSAVRFVIFIIMWCFDPLAIVLVISGVICLDDYRIIRNTKLAQEEQHRIEQERISLKQIADARKLEEKKEKVLRDEQRKLLELELNNKYKAEAEQLRHQLSECNNIISDMRNTMDDNEQLHEIIKTKDNEIDILVNETHHKNKEIDTYLSMKSDYENTIARYKDNMKEYNETIATLSMELSKIKQDHDTLIVEHTQLGKSFDATNNKLNDYEEMIKNLKNDDSVSILQAKLDEVTNTLNEKDTIITQLNENINDYKEILKNPILTPDELAIIQEELDSTKKQLNEKTAEITIKNNAIVLLKQELDKKLIKSEKIDKDLLTSLHASDKDGVIYGLKQREKIMYEIMQIIDSSIDVGLNNKKEIQRE